MARPSRWLRGSGAGAEAVTRPDLRAPSWPGSQTAPASQPPACGGRRGGSAPLSGPVTQARIPLPPYHPRSEATAPSNTPPKAAAAHAHVALLMDGGPRPVYHRVTLSSSHLSGVLKKGGDPLIGEGNDTPGAGTACAKALRHKTARSLGAAAVSLEGVCQGARRGEPRLGRGCWFSEHGTVVTPVHSNDDAYCVSFPSPREGVLLSPPLHRRQNRGPEKQTDLPQDSRSDAAGLESQPPSACLDSLVLKGHVRPREQLVTVHFTTGKHV